MSRSSSKHITLTVIISEEEDGWFVATCPVLPGCVSQGKSKEEAVKNIQEAVIGWLMVKDEKATREAKLKLGATTAPIQTLALSF